jgi:hypothetical protein
MVSDRSLTVFVFLHNYVSHHEGRKLSAVIIPERKLVQVDALKVYEAVKSQSSED